MFTGQILIVFHIFFSQHILFLNIFWVEIFLYYTKTLIGIVLLKKRLIVYLNLNLSTMGILSEMQIIPMMRRIPKV